MSAMTKTKLRELADTVKVSDHADYRSYLAAVYAQAKHEDSSYSYSRFSDDLGLGSSNAHSVIRGRRPLTEKAADRICAALHLTGVQRRYFIALVRQDRARTTADREEAFAERLDLKRRALPTELSRRQLSFFEKWYHAAILEVLRMADARDDAEWIAATLRPSVSLSDVRDSLALLQELGYVRHDEARGRLFPTQAQITTGNEAWGMAITSYHRQMLGLAVEALDCCPPEERDIGAVTVAVRREALELIKDELIAVRKKLMALSDESAGADSIVQVNLQMFLLAQKERKTR
jgi:uncharacterized protein (TIGR02147 family)